MSLEEKRWVANEHILSGKLIIKLSARFSIAVSTIQTWVTKVLKGITQHETAGQPPRLLKRKQEEVFDGITGQEFQKRTPAFVKDINAKAKETNILRGIPSGLAKPVSRRTMGKYEKKFVTKTANADKATVARAEARQDVRNAVSFAVMNALVVPMTSPELIINADATQYTVGGGVDNTQVKYCGEIKGPIKTLPEKMDGGLTSYFIKHYATINALGFSSDPVYIASDDSMGVEDFDVHSVQGLSNSTDPRAKGYLCFMNTRTPNAAFYEWYMRSVLVPFVLMLRTVHDLDVSVPAWFQIDGEAEQLSPYETGALQELLRETNIIVGKLPGGTTSWTQALDKGEYFRGSKGTLKTIKDSDAAWNRRLIEVVTAVVNAHNTRMRAMVPDRATRGV
jgi:hypothetical protein